jgi:ribonuclease HI
METIDPHLNVEMAPSSSFTTSIASDKNAARAEMEEVRRKGGFCVYTDGSGFEGGVGAAAIAWNGGKEGACRTKHLGTAGEHTVFEAEVAGAILALDIIKGSPRLTSADIFTDCQPAIIALSAPRPQPGQYLLALFHTLYRRLLRARPTLKVRIHWVPAHVGIAGNEAVDARAKEAAQGASSALASRIIPFESPLPSSRAAVADAGNKEFTARWQAEWSRSPRFLRISLFDSALPRAGVARAYSDLSRPQCSVFTQLRTAHFALNSYLYRFHLAPSPDCDLCLVPETVPHYLLSCPRYRRERLDMIISLGTARLSLRRLLAVKSDPKPALRFVRDTGRFPRYAL